MKKYRKFGREWHFCFPSVPPNIIADFNINIINDLQYRFDSLHDHSKATFQWLFFIKKMFFVYNIYSKSIDKFYIGETKDLNSQLALHNSGEFDFSYTKQANDWNFYFKLACPDRQTARKIETYIKKMKSRKYFENLVTYPEISQKLLEKYIK